MNSENIDQELEDADSTALLAKIAAETQEIRWQLQLLNDQLGASTEEPEMHLCKQCESEIQEENRREHLMNEHNAPKGLSLDPFFEPA